MSTVYKTTSQQIPAYNTQNDLNENFFTTDTDSTNFYQRAEDITECVSGRRDAPQKSILRKILNIAAKIALVATAVLFVKKTFFATVSATISSPFSLTFSLPGVFIWYVALNEEGSKLINKINRKINDLI